MSPQRLEDNLHRAIRTIERARIEYSRHHIVKLLAVSKYSQSSDIEELYHCGQRAFGENRVQDLKQKMDELRELPIEWHFIGTLQSNKINALLALRPSLIHSLHSLTLANELQKRLEREGLRIPALLQINSAKEESKSGVDPEVAIENYLEILERFPNIKLCGVMSIGAHVSDTEVIKRSFETTQRIFEELKKYGATTLSMGMSGDFELAIKCGSNLVRLGSSLFDKTL